MRPGATHLNPRTARLKALTQDGVASVHDYERRLF